MTKTIDNDIESILARATAAVDARDTTAQAPPQVGMVDEARARRLRALKASGWEAKPLRIAGAADYDESRASSYLDAIRALDDTRTGGVVVLAGNPGSGKTAAAARWALGRPNAAAGPRFAPPWFLRAAEFFRSSRYERGDGDDRPTRSEILRYQALVLDDIGAEYADASGNYRVDFDELVDRYYADDRVLVITTNLLYSSPEARTRLKAKGVTVDETAPTFSERYGERVADRIRECGRWVGSSSASMRRRVP